MLGNFSCGRYRFVLQADTPLRLNAFAGSTLRDGFGHVFKRIVCTWPPGDCPRCLLKTTCSYPYIFETAPPPGATKLRLIDQIPRPFIIEPPSADFSPSGLNPMNRATPRKLSAGNHGSAAVTGRPSSADNRKLYGPGERFDFDLVLVGRAIDYLPYFLFTFIELGRTGLGPGLTTQPTPSPPSPPNP
jgi:hypothetical protein